MSNIQAQTLLEHANNAELDIATSRLLLYLFSRDNSRLDNSNQDSSKLGSSGRYLFLKSLISENPKLLEALLKDKWSTVLSQWRKIMEKHGSNVQFYHGLAVIYQEKAVDSFNKGKPDERLWLISTALWLRLLCSNEFWEYFSSTRLTERDSSARKDLDEEQQKTLSQEVWNSILLFHNNYGRQDYAAGRYVEAGIHLKCLDLCRKDGNTIAETLSNLDIPCNIGINIKKQRGRGSKYIFDVVDDKIGNEKASVTNFDKERLDKVNSMAEGLLNDWGSTLINEAKKITDNAEAITNLPEGICKNYKGGVNYLQKFVKIGVPVTKVLCMSLQWYCDWSYDLYTKGDLKRMKNLMNPSRRVADILAPMCKKARGYVPENQVLSTHYMLRGFTSEDHNNAIKEYEEALAWNPSNDNAKKLLVQKQLDVAIECSKRNQFKEAYDVLHNLENQVEGKAQLNMTWASVRFTHANALANEGKFREALPHAREALRLEPNEKVIIDLKKELDELAPEEDNLRNIRAAGDCFEQKKFDEAISKAILVSSSSRYYGQSQILLSDVYFVRGMEYAKKEQYDLAVRDLESSLAANVNKDKKKIILEQLEVQKYNSLEGGNLRNIRIARELLEQKQFDEAISKAILVSRSSQNYEQAQNLLSTSYFARGVEYAKKEQYDLAVRDLENSLAANVNREEQKIISEQLEIQKQNRLNYEIDKALKSKNWSQAEDILRQRIASEKSSKIRRKLEEQLSMVLNAHAVSFINNSQEALRNFSESTPDIDTMKLLIESSRNMSIKLLEEAVALDRGNKVAKDNLKAIKKW
jgi:tetratricopeptide (TPR) repeat protein